MVEIVYFILVGIPPLLIGAVLFIGIVSPKNYELSESKVLDAPIEKVWSVVRDFENYPRWLSYVSHMERKPQGAKGREVWVHKGSIFTVEFEVTEQSAPNYLKTVQHKGHSPVSGTRVVNLEKVSGNQTKLTVTQTGEINDPFMRSYVILFHYRRNPVKIFVESLIAS